MDKRFLTACAVVVLLTTVFAGTTAAETVAPPYLNHNGEKAQQCSGQISGLVSLDTGSAVGGAIVLIKNASGSTITSMVTDGSGRFSSLVTAGAYSVELPVPNGFTTASPTILSVNVGCFAVEVDFQLIVAGQPTPTPASGAATAPPAPVSGASPALGLPNLLEEAEKKLREFENDWLPLKDAMFLGGQIIGIMGPELECLRFFAYIFYVPYLIALLRWFLRKEPWQEIFMGRSGFWLFMLIIAGAYPVYLTTMHELAYITFLANNGTVREALGMTLTGFAADLNPATLLNVLEFIPLLISWHLGYEIVLFITFPFFIIWSGLARNTKPLQVWVVAYACYIAFGVLWFVSLKAIEWYHGGPEMGLFQSNFFRSMLTVVNLVFIGVSTALMVLLTAIPTIHLYRVSFGGAAASAGNRLAGIDWNELVQWLVMLGLIRHPQQYAADGWNMVPPNYPQLGPHPRMLPPPSVDTRGGGGGSRGGGNGGGGRSGTDRATNAPTGNTVEGSFRELGDDATAAPPPVDLDSWHKDKADSMRADLAQWENEDAKVSGTVVPQVDAPPARGELLRGDESRVDDPPGTVAVTAPPDVDPPPRVELESSEALAEGEEHAEQGMVELPTVDRVVSDQVADLGVSGETAVLRSAGDSKATDDRRRKVVALPSVDPAPKVETEVVETSGADQHVDRAATSTPVAKASVANAQPPAKPTVKKTYRLGTMRKDHTSEDGRVLSASEPVLITVIEEKTLTTSDGIVIPKEFVDFDEEGL